MLKFLGNLILTIALSTIVSMVVTGTSVADMIVNVKTLKSFR